VFDIKYAIRSLSRARGYTIAVVLTLALGIGANTAIFSVVRGVLLKSLPHRDGDRLMYLRHSANGAGQENVLFSVPEITDFRDASKTLGGGIAEYSPITITMVEQNGAVRVNVGLVTGNYFSVMGLTPILGRAFGADDDGVKAAPVMMLTYDYWVNHFGGDSSVIGRKLRVGGKAVEVVGVLQSAPYFPAPIDALMNMVNSSHHLSAMMVTGRTHRMTEMIARLAPGATLEQATKEIDGIVANAHKDHPESYDASSNYHVTVTPFQKALGTNARLTVWLLMGVAAFVLVIACANVANLSLMRSVRREHELTVRAALGAGTTRLRQLLLTENIVLAATGSFLGLVLAFGGLRMLTTFAARYSPRANEIRIDAMVLGFTLLITLIVAVLLSFAPRLAAENQLGSMLSAGARRTTSGTRRQRLQKTLVVAQIAVSVVLLAGAGLLTRTMQQLADVDDGFDAKNVLTMEVPFDYTDQAAFATAPAMYQRMQTELAGLPGVTNVGLGSTVPLRAPQIKLEVKAEGYVPMAGEANPQADYRTAAPDYFRAAGIPLVTGREFQATDRKGTGMVVIINKTMADQFFKGREPIGQRIAWTGDVLKFIGVSDQWRTIVGVVGNTKDGGLDAKPFPVVFLPNDQAEFPSDKFVLRTKDNAEALGPAAIRALQRVAPEQPIEHVMTVDQIRDESVAPRRLNAMLVGSFSLLALVIAAIGIGAVLAFSVSARTNEIGIRMSLGADGGKVQRMVLSEGGVLVIIGLVLGVGGALLLSRLMQELLFEIKPHDPITLGGVATLMALVGIAACWIPAIRASRIDPGIALRAQ
jgi:putative ABC transport system permease protein